ncbi:MAG: hypothetical protein IKP05_00450 [Alphaproteobacteria bacterium]|nr:hypothetical protein [Alphaproteobacteria bacterium]
MKSLFTLVIALFLVAPVHAETDVSSRGTSRVLPSGATAIGSGRASGTVATSRGARTATANVARRATTARTATQTPGVVARVGTQTVAVTESGSSTRIGSRVPGVARAPSISVSSSTTTITKPTVEETISTMESVAELSDHCKAQYMACMDNFCNVLDDNQGRCTCSKNVRNYEKTEEALKTATEELQDVAQKIQYIGLTSEEIVTLFTQTEAELAMQNNSDSTKLKNDLDRIKNMIVGVKSGSASSIGDTTSGISLDLSNLLSFNIDSTGFDITSLFTTTTNNNTAAITNQRGEALYKSAAARCKAAVLNSCASQGVEIGVIVNYYDMEIDKQCILYERALTDANDQMVATVRNAKTVLQKARLMVAQQKNQYDLRGCISALDSCMQDDYVCGTDYEDCVDPSGKYIVDGEVVAGSMPGISGGMWKKTTTSGSGSSATTTTTTEANAQKGLYMTWNHGSSGSEKNIWSPKEAATGYIPYTIQQYIADTVSLSSATNGATSSEMSVYLQNKLGYHDDATGRNYGMCISVLNKCQDYTYSGGKYTPEGSAVIAGWMERALRQIKVTQDTILSKYAQSCISDVTSCLSQNNYSFYASSSASAASSSNPTNMAIRACLPVINTCRSVTLGLTDKDVTIDDLDPIYKWLDAAIATSFKDSCQKTGGTWTDATGVCACATGSTLSNGACTPPALPKTQAACSGIANAEWKNSACACKSNYTPDYSGSVAACVATTTSGT